MKKNIAIASFTCFLATTFAGCAQEGEEGSSAIDCGNHGSAHDGHCHCDSGYLFDGSTCVVPEEISAVCEPEEDISPDTEQEHVHGACRCPDEAPCPCDHGEVQRFENLDYCVPVLHED